RHADAGVGIDVLRELMDHESMDTTKRYYRVGEARRREAVDKVTAMQFDRHGNRIWRNALALLDSERARYAVGSVAVPYGTCTQPANVQAGGGACPVRFRCAGCDHFRTGVSHLPHLTGYPDDLLRTRERLAASIDGVDEWARADAMPAAEEIRRVRHLVSQIKGDIDRMDAGRRAQIDEAVSVVRRHRAAYLGMPSVRRSPRRERRPPHERACPPGSGQPRDRGHDEGPPDRLRPPTPAGPCRARPSRRRRRRDQRVRHRPGRRGGPHLHLPAPGPP